MANKINVRLILELHAGGLSQNQIAKTRHLSKTSVSTVLRIATEKGVTLQGVSTLADDELYHLFFPDKFQTERLYQLPDYDYVHSELKRVGVTLKLLWQEYTDQCHADGKFAVGYTKFCDDYGAYVSSKALTNHLQHKPGYRCEVDWSGPTMKLVNSHTGEITTVYLFVACLPYSQYAYVEPTFDMKMDTWLRCHVHMYAFFQGVPVCTICDNLKTGVVKHPKEGEIILTDAYEALGGHYVTAIMPTGVRKPKQKASVEGTVGKIATAIIAKLRNQIFHDFISLQKAVKKALADFNNAPFEKRKYSRTEVFLEEKKYLHSLPKISYEIASWERDRKVYPNCHICLKKNFYSVPSLYRGRTVDIKYTDTTIEVYCNNQRISSHAKFPDYVENQYDTFDTDMPNEFNQPQMNDERMLSWASTIGDNTLEVIQRIFRSVTIKEQGYNAALSVLKLSKNYSNDRFESACHFALKNTASPRYRYLKAILSNNQDIVMQNKQTVGLQKPSSTNNEGAYVRGSDYYGGGHSDK